MIPNLYLLQSPLVYFFSILSGKSNRSYYCFRYLFEWREASSPWVWASRLQLSETGWHDSQVL